MGTTAAVVQQFGGAGNGQTRTDSGQRMESTVNKTGVWPTSAGAGEGKESSITPRLLEQKNWVDGAFIC